MPTVTIRPGETVLRVAAERGFRRVETVWQRQENARLRERRRSPDVLAPGDEIFVPEMEAKDEACATGRRHTFVAAKPKERLRVQFAWSDGSAMAARAAQIEGGGLSLAASTNGDGWLDVELPLGTRQATVTFTDDQTAWELRIGDLDPVDEPCADAGRSGLVARLRNLALLLTDSEGDEMLRAAGAAFCKAMTREDQRMEDGRPAQLREKHGS